MLSILATIILFLLILCVLVVAHEWGHFIAARLCGVRVEEFGIGFPPRIRGWRKGVTLYTLNWIPLGGFVRLKGEQGDARTEPDSFAAQPIWKRLCILAAGVVMNFLVTILLVWFGFCIGMPQSLDFTSVPHEHIRDEKVIITSVLSHSPAQQADVKIGDVIRSVDGVDVHSVSDIQGFMRDHQGTPVHIVFQRGSERIIKDITPVQIKESGKTGIGVALDHTGVVSYGIIPAFGMAVVASFTMAHTVLTMFFQAIRHLAFDGFVGPVGIAAYTGTVSKLGFIYILNLMAQISLSLAIFNFLPFPALDGGRALFVCIEKLRGRPIRAEIENTFHLVGFALLLVVVFLVTYRDIAHLLF